MCKFCNKGELFPLDKAGTQGKMYITENGKYIVAEASDVMFVTERINYCPFCGESLNGGKKRGKRGGSRPKDGKYKCYAGSAQDYVFARAVMQREGIWTEAQKELDSVVAFERNPKVEGKDYAKAPWKQYDLLRDTCKMADVLRGDGRFPDEDPEVPFDDAQERELEPERKEQPKAKASGIAAKMAAYMG